MQQTGNPRNPLMSQNITTCHRAQNQNTVCIKSVHCTVAVAWISRTWLLHFAMQKFASWSDLRDPVCPPYKQCEWPTIQKVKIGPEAFAAFEFDCGKVHWTKRHPRVLTRASASGDSAQREIVARCYCSPSELDPECWTQLAVHNASHVVSYTCCVRLRVAR